MTRFSERLGITAAPLVQIGAMNDDLTVSLWNMILTVFEEVDPNWSTTRSLAQFFFKASRDELPNHGYDRMKWLKGRFYGLNWWQTYELIEHLVDRCEIIFAGDGYDQRPKIRKDQLAGLFNRILQSESSGYRFINGQLAPISNEEEVAAVEDAIGATINQGLSGANQHLRAAVQLLGRKPNPDYRNSVKESISAVESLAKKATGKDKASLGEAIDTLAKQVPIHGSMRGGFLKMYGYTSDESGIRHALLDETNVGYDEAKYMLVSCSAFVNYLTSKLSGGN